MRSVTNIDILCQAKKPTCGKGQYSVLKVGRLLGGRIPGLAYVPMLKIPNGMIDFSAITYVTITNDISRQ